MDQIDRQENKMKKRLVYSFLRQCKDQMDRQALRKIARKPNTRIWDQLLDRKIKELVIEDTCKRTMVIKEMPFRKSLVALDKCPRGRILERILTSLWYCGQLCHLVKWKGANKCNLVVNTALNEKFPLKVINYYEDHLFVVTSRQFDCTQGKQLNQCYIKPKKNAKKEEEVRSRRRKRLFRNTKILFE